MMTQTQMARAKARITRKSAPPPGAISSPETKTTTPPPEAAPRVPGQSAASHVFGKNNLAAGNYIANTYVPPAQQINTAPTTDTQNALAAERAGTTRSTDQQDILNRQNDIATNGLGAQEFQGLRDQMNQGLNSSYATSESNLARAQAQGKVYGAAGSAQQANLINATDANRVNNEQQLMLKSGDVRRQGLQNYSNTLNSQDAQIGTNSANYANSAQTSSNATTDAQKFNAGEQDATTAAKLGAIFNTAGLGQNNLNNNTQQGLGADAIGANGGSLDNYHAALAKNKKSR